MSNHQVSITPTVTNVSGYIDGGTKNGTAITVSASELVSGTQTFTTNNTYDVTTLSSVVVQVTGNMVEGTFTTPSTNGVSSISIPYTGTSYPISCIVVVEGGAYESGTGWYTTIQRYAVGQWTLTKAVFSSSPTYATSGSQNQGVTT